MRCNECRGKGKIALLTSVVACERCGGTGTLPDAVAAEPVGVAVALFDYTLLASALITLPHEQTGPGDGLPMPDGTWRSLKQIHDAFFLPASWMITSIQHFRSFPETYAGYLRGPGLPPSTVPPAEIVLKYRQEYDAAGKRTVHFDGWKQISE